MPGTPQKSRVVILVKALPQPSKLYGETVCCAGVTPDGEWKRLYPVRFRHLQGDSAFKRWDWVDFQHTRPVSDTRKESCHVHEHSIAVDGQLKARERAGFLAPLIVRSAKEAVERGESLALIRPRKPKFIAKRRSSEKIEEQRDAFQRAASQNSLFDKKLAELEPTPYDFRFTFEDDGGSHDYQNGDWEAHAMFWHERQRFDEERALKFMHEKFNDEYPAKGMVFAIGNQAKRPQTWQLLGVIRADVVEQAAFEL